MTHAEMIREYTRSYKNMLSTSAEKRLAQLEAEAAKEGLRFQMINERQWMLPHFIHVHNGCKLFEQFPSIQLFFAVTNRNLRACHGFFEKTCAHLRKLN